MVEMNRRNFIRISSGLGAAMFALPTEPMAKLQNVTNQNSIQGESFIDFLQKYGVENPPELIYRNGEDFGNWQAEFRKKIENLRCKLPDRVKLEIEILKVEELKSHIRKLIRFPVSKYSRVIAYILLPKNLKKGEKRPGIVALHGHTQLGINHICGVKEGYTPYALSAVHAGYVVIAPAWWGWFGRDGHLDKVGERDKCNVIQTAAAMYGLNVVDLHIQDGQASVDALTQLPEVNSDSIGCIGNSYGGRMTMWLTLFEERINACVPSGCMNNFRERSLKLSSCGIQYLPGLLRYGDVPEVFSLIAPRPMQLQSGEGDNLITPEDRDQMKIVVHNAYRSLGLEKNFEYVLHDKGHSLQWTLAEPFLRQHLS
jgi:hypothetical protein